MLSIPKRVILILLEFTLAFLIMISLYTTLFNGTAVGDSYFGYSSLYNMLIDIDSNRFFTFDDLLPFVKSLTLPVNLSSPDFSWLDALYLLLNFAWVPLLFVIGFGLFILSYVLQIIVVIISAFNGYYNIPLDSQYCMSCQIPLIL